MLSMHASYAAFVLIFFLTHSRKDFIFGPYSDFDYCISFILKKKQKTVGTSFKTVSLLLEKGVDKVGT